MMNTVTKERLMDLEESDESLAGGRIYVGRLQQKGSAEYQGGGPCRYNQTLRDGSWAPVPIAARRCSAGSNAWMG
jgi:hypothetical protein